MVQAPDDSLYVRVRSWVVVRMQGPHVRSILLIVLAFALWLAIVALCAWHLWQFTDVPRIRL